MKTIKELDKMIEDEDADAYHIGCQDALKDVLGLIDEELPNLPSIEIILNRLKKKING